MSFLWIHYNLSVGMMLVWWRTIFLMSVCSALACFFLNSVCLLKTKLNRLKNSFTNFLLAGLSSAGNCSLTLIMSADCLLGTLVADLLISVVLFLSVSVWRICWCLSGLNLSVSLASVFPVSSVSVCLKCFPTSFAGSFLYCQCLSGWACWCLSGMNPSEGITWCFLWINPMSFLLVSIWWVMISVCLS